MDIRGLYGIHWDNGKENGNYYSCMQTTDGTPDDLSYGAIRSERSKEKAASQETDLISCV